MNRTPDQWIERNERDFDGPMMSDEEMCEEGLCGHVAHCEECGKGFDYALPADDPVCLDCQIRWQARHQLGGSSSRGA